MSIPIPVSVTTDWMFPIPLCVLHSSAPAPPELPHLELPLPLLWPPGMAIGQNQFTSKVLHGGRCIAQAGHDMGSMIPHVPLGTNVLLPFVILFSSRAVNFSAAAVLADGTPIAIITAIAPMSVCAFPTAWPTGMVLNVTNTTSVGYTLSDAMLGLLNIATTALTDLVCWRIGKMAGPSPFGSAVRNQEGDIVSRRFRDVVTDPRYLTELAQQFLFGGPGGNGLWINAVGQWAGRTAVSVASGLFRAATTGQGGFNVGVGQPYFGEQLGVGLSRHHEGDESVRHLAGYDISITHQSSRWNHATSTTYNADRTVTTQEVTRGGFGARSVTHHVDAQGRPMSDDNKVSDGHPWGSAL